MLHSFTNIYLICPKQLDFLNDKTECLIVSPCYYFIVSETSNVETQKIYSPVFVCGAKLLMEVFFNEVSTLSYLKDGFSGHVVLGSA